MEAVGVGEEKLVLNSQDRTFTITMKMDGTCVIGVVVNGMHDV